MSQSIRVGRSKLDEAIIRRIRRVYNLMIGSELMEIRAATLSTACPRR